MLLRTDLDHESVCVMGRDRIVWLARQLAQREAVVAELTSRLDAIHWALTEYPKRNTHQLQATKVCAGVMALAGEGEASKELAKELWRLRDTWSAWTQILASAQEVAPEEFASAAHGTNLDRVLRVIGRPGAMNKLLEEARRCVDGVGDLDDLRTAIAHAQGDIPC